jgi:homoserine kinase type II
MAVHTKFSFEEIKNHLEQNYQLGELISVTEIVDGIDNSNFLLKIATPVIGDQKFIFTVFESRINGNDLPFFINLKLHLANRKITCPKPIATNNKGQVIANINSKKSILVTFLNGNILKPKQDGYYDNITNKHCFEVGEILAKMHLGVSDFNLSRVNDLGILGWQNLLAKFSHLLNQYQPGLEDNITNILTFLTKSWQDNLPSGAVHLDLFPDNVFFDAENKVSGVIDFYFAANDSFIYDFAITVNAWCFDQYNNFDQEKFKSMMNGYNNYRKFSNEELNFLPIALIGGSLRLSLTRLHDLFFTPKDSLVKIKDPQEYLTKLNFFKSQYGN